MPIVGIIDPSHDERKASGKQGHVPKWLSIEGVLERAALADPKWSPWTYELLYAAIGELEDRGDHISTTALVTPCPRSLVLERKEEYVVDIDELWRAFRGTMVHYVLEAGARPGSIAEVRFSMPFGDDMLSCKPDLITPDGIMWDYKNKAQNPTYGMPTYNQEQLQINRWIVNNATDWRKNDKPYDLPFDVRTMSFQHLVIAYLDLNGPKLLETERSVQVPNKTGPGTHPVRIPSIWTDKEVRDLVSPRFHALRAALDAYPEWPDGIENVWGGPPGWACPGWPYCPLRGKCLASRYPNGLVW